ncbi:MAG: GerMN domain-containing protein [Spirochaetes bacterium]|nr:GerMN domain-containing protein [Spirochaetota bacterium]MBN2770495.1 GerMN domain-containing protein [Spirochaetota bacterium]
MSSGKVSKKLSKKRITKKTPDKRGKAQKPVPVSGAKNAVLILIVMALVTVLVFMGVQMLKIKNAPHTRVEKSIVEPDKSLTDSKKSKDESKKNEKPDDRSTVAGETSTDKAKIPDLVTGNIYLLFFDERSELITLRPVARRFRSDQLLTDALSMLVKGPLKEEKNKGFETSLSPSMRFNTIKVKNKIAYIDINPEFVKDSFGDIGVARVNQVFLTLTQFDSINGIVITVNGKKIDTMDDGRHFVWPMTRRL